MIARDKIWKRGKYDNISSWIAIFNHSGSGYIPRIGFVSIILIGLASSHAKLYLHGPTQLHISVEEVQQINRIVLFVLVQLICPALTSSFRKYTCAM